MAENISQETGQTPNVVDWESLADNYRTWHPALQAHAERYLEKNGVDYAGTTSETEHSSALQHEAGVLHKQREECLALIQSDDTDEKERSLAIAAVWYTYNGLTKVETRQVYQALVNNEGHDVSDVRGVVREVAETMRFFDLHKKELDFDDESISRQHALPFLGSLPAEILQQLYAERAEPAGKDFTYVLNRSAHAADTDINEVTQVLSRTLQTSVASLMTVNAPLLRSGIDATINRRAFNIAAVQSWSNELPPGMTQAEYNRQLMSETYLILTNAGLPSEMVFELVRASDVRTLQQEDGVIDYKNPAIDVGMLKVMTSGTLYNLNKVGVETFTQLYDKCGIRNFDYYNEQELMRMKYFVEGDQEYIKHLTEGDVTVVLTDGQGDYNGAFMGVVYKHSDTNNRTLFFEVNRQTDLYRYMTWVHKQGILPSTIVLAAHGRPGEMGFGRQGSDRFQLHNRHNYNQEMVEYGPSLQTATGLARLIADYMQDGRGIDGPDEAKGKRRLILASCSQAVQRHAITYIEEAKRHGLLRKKGLPTVTNVMESTADTMVKVAQHPNLEVLAPPADVAVAATEQGIEYWDIIDGARMKVPIRRHRLGANGEVLIDDHDELIVRRETVA